MLTDVVASQAFPSDLEHAIAFDHLGVVQRERTHYAQAEDSLARALTLLENNSAAEARRARAQVFNDRGGLRTYESDFRGALEAFHQALELYRDLGMLRTVDAAKVLNNIGNAHRELGDTGQARSALLQALDLKTELLGVDNPSTASTITNLGMVAEESHDYLGAQTYYARALAIYEKSLGANHANVASVAEQYGRLRFTTAQYADALQLLERARAIREREFGLYSTWSAETLVDLVPVYGQLGQRRRARDSAERALTIAVTGREQELLYDSYMSYARTLAAPGQSSAAIFFGKRALNVIQQMRERDVPPTKREQRFFIMRREFMYRDVADWLLSQSRLVEAEEVLDLLKAEELADYAQLPARPAESVTARVGLVQGEVQAAATLDAAIQNLAQQLGAVRLESSLLAAARADFRSKLKEIVASLADPNPNPERTQRDLATLSPSPRDSAIVRYLVLADRVRILVRTPTTLFAQSVKIDRTELSRQVLELHHRLQSHLRAEAAARTLFQELIAPISSTLALAEIHDLVLMPDDVL
ncbi:MAG TPA: tetratricopeptide repeat protein, partial [Steroidobacteraceae bacterium]